MLITARRTIPLAAPPSNLNAKHCAALSWCSGATLGIIIGSGVLIFMAICVAYCCNRAHRKAKNTVKGKVLGMIFKSFKSSKNGKGDQPADDEEQLRPQQPPPPPPGDPQFQAPTYYQQQPYSNGNPADAPYEYPRYPEYPQFQGQHPQYPPQNQPWQPRQPQPSKREAKQQKQQTRAAISPEETPAETQMRLNRLATALASSM
ncbi:hypothetical protein SBRCBS47491_000477 [Sporothrix bragantina]|uniref:Uncharacterized protein n=1 Tax=Sporothrix bragantina TaxID=671064 RepID=A0ABP0AQJ3_9PEZI